MQQVQQVHETKPKVGVRIAHMNNAAVETNIPSNMSTTPGNMAPTPGWKTSEFWMTALGHAGLILAASSGALPPKYAAMAGALSQLAYNLSRGLTKSSAANCGN